MQTGRNIGSCKLPISTWWEHPIIVDFFPLQGGEVCVLPETEELPEDLLDAVLDAVILAGHSWP